VALAHTDQGGQLNLYICSFSYFIQIGATDFNWALAYAAQGGHKDLCRYFIKIGATDFNMAIRHAKDQPTKDFLIQAQNEKKGFVL